ncbi:MAG TPA: ferritin-like domain-containing protein [Solirubrobacterales bacterium]|nr:ferritin-like domain-containing protein [Solirubrobacterales bacterium]
MALNRITRGRAAPRALLLATVALVMALALASCGGDGEGPTAAAPVVDKAADAETLNNVLSRELAAVRAYERTLPLLRGEALAAAREFRAQEQEHADAVVKALRGLGEPAEPKEEEIESEGLRTQADALAFLYDVESVSVAYDLRALSHLTASWPRVLLASIAANQAQHLVVLRRLLGADPPESIPEAFEDGTTPDPSEMIKE